jgi:hypothetical protein
LEEVKTKEGALALVVRGNPKAKRLQGKALEIPKVSKAGQVRAFLQGLGKVGVVWAKA